MTTKTRILCLGIALFSFSCVHHVQIEPSDKPFVIDLNVKIDHVFSQRHRLATSYSYETVNADDTYEGWPDSFEGRVQRQPQVLSANITSTLTPSLVNEGRFGMSRQGTNVHHATSVPGHEKLLELLPKSNGLTILPQWPLRLMEDHERLSTGGLQPKLSTIDYDLLNTTALRRSLEPAQHAPIAVMD